MLRGRWALLVLVVVLAGCGYRFMGAETPTTTTKGRPVLAIPLFANRTTEVGLEAIFADALIHAFSQNNSVRVTHRPDDADLVLQGKVQSLENSSVAFFDVNRSSVRRVTLRVEMVLRQRQGDKVLWKDTMVLKEDYVVDPNYQFGEVIKSEGVRRAAVNLARRVVDKVLLVI